MAKPNEFSLETAMLYYDSLDLFRVLLNSSNFSRDAMVESQLANLEKTALDINTDNHQMVWHTNTKNDGLSFALEVLEPSSGIIRIAKHEPWTRIARINLFGRIHEDE